MSKLTTAILNHRNNYTSFSLMKPSVMSFKTNVIENIIEFNFICNKKIKLS